MHLLFLFAVSKDSNEEGEKRTAFFGRKQSGGLFSPNGDKERQRRDRRGSAEKILVPQPKKTKSLSTWSFFIRSEGLVCNLTAGEYVIAEGVCHHALACISFSNLYRATLRADYMRFLVVI